MLVLLYKSDAAAAAKKWGSAGFGKPGPKKCVCRLLGSFWRFWQIMYVRVFSKNWRHFFRSPRNKDHGILGSVLAPTPIVGNSSYFGGPGETRVEETFLLRNTDDALGCLANSTAQ